MGRWKRFGVVVVLTKSDHPPRHLHVFEDGKRVMKFNIEEGVVMEGVMTTKAKKALESLRMDGVFG